MFFNKEKDNFELKTEDSSTKYDEFDDDFFRYEDEEYDEYTVPATTYKATPVSDSYTFEDEEYDQDTLTIFPDNLKKENTYQAESITQTNNIYDTETKSEVNNYYKEKETIQENNYFYTEPKTTEVNNYFFDDSINDNYVSDETVTNINVNKKEEKKKNNVFIFNNFKTKISKRKTSTESNIPKGLAGIIFVLNRVLSVLLFIVVVIAIIVIFDFFMLTRFEKGPFFAIKTKTYQDGGTKEYYGIGYKVIKYNVDGGRSDLVVGNYKVKYNVVPEEKSLDEIAKSLKSNPDDSYKELSKKFVSIEAKVSKVSKENRTITLVSKDDSTYDVVLNCDMSYYFDDYNKIKKNKTIKVEGVLYIEEISDTIKLYLDKGVVR